MEDPRAPQRRSRTDRMVRQRRRNQAVADLRSALRTKHEFVKVGEETASFPPADVAAVAFRKREQRVPIQVIADDADGSTVTKVVQQGIPTLAGTGNRITEFQAESGPSGCPPSRRSRFGGTRAAARAD